MKNTYIEIIPDTGVSDDLHIVSGTLRLDHVLSTGRLNFGESNASKFEVQVVNMPDVSNRQIKVYQTSGSTYTSDDLVFTGYIDSCKQNEFGNYRKIVAYDALYYYRSYNISDWWNEWRLTYPHPTMQFLLEALLDIVDLDYVVRDGDIEDLVNYDTLAYTGFTMGNKKWGDLIYEVLQVMCVYGHIREDGKLELIRLNPNILTAKDITGSYKRGESTFEGYTTHTITGLCIKDSVANLVTTGDLATNPYTMNTMLLSNLNMDTLEDVAEAILTEIEDITYIPVTIEMLEADTALQVGDLITTEKGDSYIMKTSFSGIMMFEQEIIADGDEYLEQVTSASEQNFTTKTSSVPQYYLSTSNQTQSGGAWSNTFPPYVPNRYYWIRYATTYPNGTVGYSDPVLANGLNDANSKAVQNSSDITQLNTEILLKVNKTEIIRNINQSLETEKIAAETVDLSDYDTHTQVNALVQNLQQQIDKEIDTWFYDYDPTLSNLPASEWTTDVLKERHINDIFFNNSSGTAWRFTKNSVTGAYAWVVLGDSAITEALRIANEAKDVADGKRRAFVETPVPPYDIGDMWLQGIDGDVLRCQNSKADGESYSADDWVKASKYTDDVLAESALELAQNAQGRIDDVSATANAVANIARTNSASIDELNDKILATVSQEDYNTLTEMVQSRLASLELNINQFKVLFGEDGNYTKWFSFDKNGNLVIGDASSPVHSEATNDSYKFVDDSGNELLTLSATDGAKIPTVNVENQISFQYVEPGSDPVPQWAIRKGAYIEGVGTNLNDLWIG